MCLVFTIVDLTLVYNIQLVKTNNVRRTDGIFDVIEYSPYYRNHHYSD